jgi:hypothetical protein
LTTVASNDCVLRSPADEKRDSSPSALSVADSPGASEIGARRRKSVPDTSRSSVTTFATLVERFTRARYLTCLWVEAPGAATIVVVVAPVTFPCEVPGTKVVAVLSA